MIIYDITVPLSQDTHVYEGDPPVRISSLSRIASGDSADVSSISMCTHSGTHIDAPSHFIPNGSTVDTLSLDLLMGECLVCDMGNTKTIRVRDLENADISSGTKRVLFKTSNSKLWNGDRFSKDFVYLEEDAAEWLVRMGIRVIGIDYLSVDGFKSKSSPVHRRMLLAGNIVIEGLDLRAVPAGNYTLICLPMKISGGDGAPSRVVLVSKGDVFGR